MKIETAVREYLIEIEVRKYTPRTVKGYRTNLNLFLRFCKEKSMIEKVEDISLGVVKQLTQFLTGQGKKGNYVNTILKTIKSFIQYCYEEDYGGFNTKKNFQVVQRGKACYYNLPAFPADLSLADLQTFLWTGRFSTSCHRLCRWIFIFVDI